MVQCNEKGLLVCFGFPLAFEDAAVRAARTGLGLLDGMKILGERFRQDKLDLNPWIGIHTGPAIVESKEGSCRWWATRVILRSGWMKLPSPVR